MGADRKLHRYRWVRAPSGLLEPLQHRVALETLCKRDSSFGAELVARETAGVGFGGYIVSRVNGR